MFEKKNKNKTHKPKRPTWPLKPTSSHYPLYPHYTESFEALSEFLLDVDCIACFLFLPHHTRLFFQWSPK